MNDNSMNHNNLITRCLSAISLIVLTAAVAVMSGTGRIVTERADTDTNSAYRTQDCAKGVQQEPIQSEVVPPEQLVSEIAGRSIVRIAIGQYAGCGIIWSVTEEEIVIATNRHLLMKGVEAEVTCPDGDVIRAEILGSSQQYDIAFCRIHTEDMSESLRQSIEEVKKPLEISWKERTRPNTPIIHAAYAEETAGNDCHGIIETCVYIPEFGTQMLQTRCYSKAGMSGGGVFDEEGWLLGMITGGQAAESGMKESDITYSIPTTLIESEYQILYEQSQHND